MKLVPPVSLEDKAALRRYLQKLASLLGPEAVPTHAGLTLTDLTASRLVATDASKEFESVPGTSVHPEFAGITIKDSGDNIVFYVDDDEMYFTVVVIPIEAGMSMGLLLALTYAAP
jgi:hypothetical protein